MAIEFPGETHAAVHLDVLLHAQLRSLRCTHAGGGSSLGQIFRVLRQRPGTVVAVGARERHRHVHVHQLVLDRLERTDRAAERVALEGKVPRHLKGAFGTSELFEGRQHRRAIEALGQRRPAIGHQQFGACGFEFDARLVTAGVDRRHRRARHARCIQFHEVERNALCAAGDHDAQVCNSAIEHRQLAAGEAAALEAALDAFRRRLPRLLRERQAGDRGAAGEPRQPAVLLFGAAVGEDQFRGDADGRRERQGRIGAADLFADGAQLQVASAGAAVVLGDGRAEEPQLAKGRPQAAVQARAGFQHLAHSSRGAEVAKDPPRLLLDLLLFG